MCGDDYVDKAGSAMRSERATLYAPQAPEIEGFTFVEWVVVASDLADGITIQAAYQANEPTSAPAVYVNPANKAQKLIRNGSVYILTTDHTYTVSGTEVR